MTMDDYLAARPVSTPFGLFDCDVPIDGSIALVVSHADYAADCPNRPVAVEAIGGAYGLGRVVSSRRLPEDGVDRSRRPRCGRAPISRRRM